MALLLSVISSPGTTAGIFSGSTLSLLATSGASEGTSSGNSLAAGISVSPVNWISRSSSGISPSSEPSPSAGDSTSAGSTTAPGATAALGSEKGSTVLLGATGTGKSFLAEEYLKGYSNVKATISNAICCFDLINLLLYCCYLLNFSGL